MGPVGAGARWREEPTAVCGKETKKVRKWHGAMYSSYAKATETMRAGAGAVVPTHATCIQHQHCRWTAVITYCTVAVDSVCRVTPAGNETREPRIFGCLPYFWICCVNIWRSPPECWPTSGSHSTGYHSTHPQTLPSTAVRVAVCWCQGGRVYTTWDTWFVFLCPCEVSPRLFLRAKDAKHVVRCTTVHTRL